MTWLAVATGGAIGSLLRHSVNVVVASVVHQPSPYATAIVNLLGSFAIGLLAGAIAGGRLQLTPAGRTFIFVGIIGGFTTFSSFGLDTFTLAHTGRAAAAFWNVALQVGLGLAGVFAGFHLAV